MCVCFCARLTTCRHHGHFLFAEHWAKGNGATNAALKGWKGTMLPVFIDHAAGFRPEAVVEMRHENAFNTGAATRISARTYLRLRYPVAWTSTVPHSRMPPTPIQSGHPQQC